MSRYSFPAFLFPLFCLLFVAACTSDPQEQQAGSDESNSAIGIPLTPEDKACLASSEAICELGLSFALLGQSMEELKLPNPETFDVSDEVLEAGGYYWNSKTLQTPAGTIVLEGDFIDERAAGQEDLPENNRIFRIRIESTEFSTPNGIQVGSNLGDLKNIIGEADLQAQYLPDFQSIDISVPNSRIRYLIRDENGQYDELTTPEVISIEEVPDGIPVYALVLIRDF